MRRLIAIIAVCLIGVTAANAQTYSKAIGVEGGWEGVGLTFKQFTTSGRAFMDYKAQIDFWNGNFGALASATYDFNKHIGNDFHFFYGFGAEAGFFMGQFAGKKYGGDVMAGAFANIGLEYDFTGIPFALSVDWNPGLRLILGRDFGLAFSGKALCMGVKVTF